jgi:hypothetical protein
VATSELVKQGAESNLMIKSDQYLGDPGIYIKDAELAWTNWQSMGNYGVMKHLMSSDDALPGMVRPSDAAKRIVEHMFQVAGRAQGIHVFVTHDTILVPTVAHASSESVSEENWPRFLEGAFFWRDNGGLHSAYWLKRK